MKFSKSEMDIIYQYAAPTKAETLSGMKEIVPVIKDLLTKAIVENAIRKLEKLNQEIEKTEARLRRAQHKEKMLEHQIKTLNRKERTHRLCTRGAMLESHLPHPESVTDEQVSTILKVLFHRGDTKRLVAQVLTENRKEDTE